ncbi:hypothetical protein EHP00_2263 [Ecytonucleospora hepatopenaei]|uniref:Uncharacterized protein n=1 Tax=Ecytonucleospora hepatopenaei TaxID=646526 RepID=A0A1W0E3Z4_9MICR|nr:hypothetical protein EHP00_2263 [Ecytonucleospora hepatopenaei]
MLFNILYILYIYIKLHINIIYLNILYFNINNVKCANQIHLNNNVIVTLLNNDNNFTIKYNIVEIDPLNEIINTNINNWYYFYITDYNHNRLFTVNRSFILGENSIVLYNNKKYKIYNTNDNINDILVVPLSSYRIINNSDNIKSNNTKYNDLCCIGSNSYILFDNLRIHNLLFLPKYPTEIKYSTEVEMCNLYNKPTNYYDNFDIIKKFIMGNIFNKTNKKISKYYRRLLIGHSKCFRLFVINTEKFKEFISDKNYSIGKCYESSTQAEFLEENPQILLTDCTLVEIGNSSKM